MALLLKSSTLSVSAARPRVAHRSAVRTTRMVVVRSAPKDGAVEQAIKEAKEACTDGTTKDCAVAWDTVEEISAAADKAKRQAIEDSDPLEKFCKDAPDADECRVYED